MGAPALSVGARIFEAIRRTREAVDCNTNLGIVLLCAPLAQAALSSGKESLRDRVRWVLEKLDVADAEQAFAAIRLAEPGGLGTAPQHDRARRGDRFCSPSPWRPRPTAIASPRSMRTDLLTSSTSGCRVCGPAWNAGVASDGRRRRPISRFSPACPTVTLRAKHGIERAEAICAKARPYAERLDETESNT
mgnify:CR=1 FL=1